MQIPSAPSGFEQLSQDTYERARERVWKAVDETSAVDHLMAYYDPTGDYAGATFVEALPLEKASFSAADLFAVTLLSVRPARPRRARLFLDEGPERSELTRLLGAPRLGMDSELRYADNETLLEMSGLYKFVKETLGQDPWVTASKLCARKRPQLFPVRDELVRDYLGLTSLRNFEVDWQVFRALTLDHEIWERLGTLDLIVHQAGTRLDSYPLRWLDVVLWMTARAAM